MDSIKKIALIILSLYSVSCASRKESQISKTTIVKSLDVEDGEYEHLKKKALRGDGQAAYRLANYFGFVLGDENTSLYWMNESARLGNSSAIEYLESVPEAGF